MSVEEQIYIDTLYKQNYNLLYHLACKKMQNAQDAEDLVQSVFLTACIRSSALLQHPNPLGWLTKTMQIMILKYANEEGNFALPLEKVYFNPTEEIQLPLTFLFPGTLTKKETVALQMRFEWSASYYEIANQLETSEQNSRKIVSRALKKCREEWPLPDGKNDPAKD